MGSRAKDGVAKDGDESVPCIRPSRLAINQGFGVGEGHWELILARPRVMQCVEYKAR
jgi:hypothetical protein